MLKYYMRRSLGEDYEEVNEPANTEGLWVFGTGVHRGDIDRVVHEYDLDKNIVYDVLDDDELPRVEYDKQGFTYVFLRSPWKTRRGGIATAPLLTIATSTAFITLTKLPLDGPVVSGNKQLKELDTTDTTESLLATIAGTLAKYEELIQQTTQVVLDVGHKLRKHEITNDDFLRFVTIEGNLNVYVYNLDAMISVVYRLRDDVRKTPDKHDDELADDIILYIRQLLAKVESHRQMMGSIQNVYSTISNNRLNERMKTLTVLTVLIALPNVFYGMYGMNVALPFQQSPWAYAGIVVFTILLVGIVYAIAKRSRIF